MGDGYWAVEMKISGWLAQFRQHATVTTQLTHILPPKSTVLGFLFAKRGIMRLSYNNKKSREELINFYSHYMDKIQIAAAYSSKVLSTYMDYVDYLIEYQQKPTNIEYLIMPEYRFIYLLPEDDKYFGIAQKEDILNKEFFKIHLGKNEALANEVLAREISVNEISEKEISTNFAIREDFIRYIDLSQYLENLKIEDLPITALYKQGGLSKKKYVVPIGEEPITVSLNEGVKAYAAGSEKFVVM